MPKKLVYALMAAALLAGLFLYLSLSPIQVECEVVVEYQGKTASARAASATQPEALKAAVITACGQLTHGRIEIMRCAGPPPKSVVCK